MPKAKGSKETETKRLAVDPSRPLALDSLLRELDNLLELIAVKASTHSDALSDPFLPSVALCAARRLADRWLNDVKPGNGPSTSEGSAAYVEDAWRRAVIETQEGRVHQQTAAPSEGKDEAEDALAELAEERATYRDRLPELVREHEGRFVLIKGQNLVGVFSDRSAALQEGYRRFGIVPFLVRQVAASEPVVYLPNVVP
jgi:hypothetical protein